MNERYETKIPDARWWAYDLPGNAGWILYFVCVGKMLRKGLSLFAAAALLPAALMLTGVAELVSERIAGLDRVLPKKRLLRGFGALTLGGGLGAILSAAGLRARKSSPWMLLGSILCAVFAGLLFKGYRRLED